MKKKFLSIVIIALMWIGILYFAFGSELGTNAMADIHEKYPDNIIDFDDYSQSDDPIESSRGYVKPESRIFTPPSEESLKLTREKVQAFDCGTIEGATIRECQALVALYASTNGAAWTNNTNWLESKAVGEWYGIRTNYENIWGLVLNENNLSGTLPPEIGNLSELDYLALSKNFISGNLPSELSQLEKLEYLHLDDNLLNGPILSDIGMMSNLKIIRLNNNLFSGQIPASLGHLNHAWELVLCNNKLTGRIPAELGQVGNLWHLDLSGNQLSGPVPSELGDIRGLGSLLLSSNQLSGNIPPELGNLTNLYYLAIADNMLSGSIPAEFVNLSKLGYLFLQNNRLSGTIPAEIGALTNLITLNLSHNKFEGALPESFTNLVNLGKYTDLGYNRLNVPQAEPVQSFLNEKDPDWYLTQAIQTTIPCDLGGEIFLHNNRVEITIPAGACDGELDVLLTPLVGPSHDYKPMYWGKNSFELSAWNAHGSVTQFLKPLSFTIYYFEDDFNVMPEEELVVKLFDKDYAVWRDAISTCPDGEYTRNFDENWLRLPVCHLTEFGLFNLLELPFRLYLPIGLK